MNKLNRKIKNLPKEPGVYLFKKDKAVVYVGKAKNLKARIASYFRNRSGLAPDKAIMVSDITDLDYIITSSETEALFLESNLVKKHRPKYNVILKDDKNFIYIKITKEDYPLITLVRRLSRDKASYFGPYLSARHTRDTLDILKRLFGFRACQNLPKRTCLLFHLGYCPGPCENKIDKKEYQEIIKKIVRFLKGDQEGILKDLKEEMLAAARHKEFEKAAKLRDKIIPLKKMLSRQRMITAKNINEDILSLSRKENTSAINLFAIRNGKVTERQAFLMENTGNIDAAEIYQNFIKQYYSEIPDKPRRVVLNIDLNEKALLEKAYQIKLEKAVKARRGQLIVLGEKNALEYLEKSLYYWRRTEEKSKKALADLKRQLDLTEIPARIEAYDISNIQGADPVGSMIVFEKGAAKKSDYRKFKIRTVKGANDTAMMAEVLSRRFKNEAWPLPDLIILDGGKGQLSAGLKSLRVAKKKISMLALAKKKEDIYLPGRKNPINLKTPSEALFLLQRIRDEAHRFAIGFFRKKHGLESYRSILDEIPGLGPKTKRKLLDAFGSVINIGKAKNSEIARVAGRKLTKKIREYI